MFNIYVFSVKTSANIPDKDYYLTINVKHNGQRKKVISKRCIHESFESLARRALSNNNQPSAKVIADKLGEMVEADMDEKC